MRRRGGPIVATCTIGEAIPVRRTQFNEHFRAHRVRARRAGAIYLAGSLFALPTRASLS